MPRWTKAGGFPFRTAGPGHHSSHNGRRARTVPAPDALSLLLWSARRTRGSAGRSLPVSDRFRQLIAKGRWIKAQNLCKGRIE